MADLSEREAYASLINAMSVGRDSARALALLRSDQRWLAVASIFDACRDNSEKLFTKSRRQGNTPLVTPAGKPLKLPGLPN